MAIHTLSPYEVASDMHTLQECVDLLKPTGLPVSKSQLRRWITKYGLSTQKHGQKIRVSFSDILMAHQEESTDRP